MQVLVSIAFVILLYSAPGSYRDGDYRLVGGAYNWEGRVEIFQSGSWSTISDSSWTDDDVYSVCIQLQHSQGTSGFDHQYRIYTCTPLCYRK